MEKITYVTESSWLYSIADLRIIASESVARFDKLANKADELAMAVLTAQLGINSVPLDAFVDDIIELSELSTAGDILEELTDIYYTDIYSHLGTVTTGNSKLGLRRISDDTVLIYVSTPINTPPPVDTVESLRLLMAKEIDDGAYYSERLRNEFKLPY